MAKCTYCSKETQLYINGMPICPSCDADIEAGRTPPSSNRPLKPPKDP
jgi:hypothetical protein